MISDFYNSFKDWALARKWRKSANKGVINGVVLMYHHITNDYVSINQSCRCPIRVFEHYLDDYVNKGYHFVSIEEAYRIIVERNPTPFCVVTFDDIPDDVFTNAYPILKRKTIPFTVFVTTNLVDYTDPQTNRVFITKNHLNELSKEPLCTIGAHTISHPMLKRVNDSIKEMKNNKEWLESIAGYNVDFIAYPYGKHSSVSRRIQKEAKKLGFKCAFSSIDAPVTDISSKQLFFLPRIVKN